MMDTIGTMTFNPTVFLEWKHKNGRTYKRRVRSKTFAVPPNAIDFHIVVSYTNGG